MLRTGRREDEFSPESRSLFVFQNANRSAAIQSQYVVTVAHQPRLSLADYSVLHTFPDAPGVMIREQHLDLIVVHE